MQLNEMQIFEKYHDQIKNHDEHFFLGIEFKDIQVHVEQVKSVIQDPEDAQNTTIVYFMDLIKQAWKDLDSAQKNRLWDSVHKINLNYLKFMFNYLRYQQKK